MVKPVREIVPTGGTRTFAPGRATRGRRARVSENLQRGCGRARHTPSSVHAEASRGRERAAS
eukprot:4755382-Prymnesium_polylepis.2